MDDYPSEPAAIYDDLREKWKHEDELINKRVTWLLSSQGFLLAAYGVVAGLLYKPAEVTSTTTVTAGTKVGAFSLLLLELALPVVALFVLHFLKLGISAAVKAMREIKRTLADHQKNGRTWSKMRVDILQETTDHGAWAPVRLSTALQVMWFVLLLMELLRFVLTLRPPP